MLLTFYLIREASLTRFRFFVCLEGLRLVMVIAWVKKKKTKKGGNKIDERGIALSGMRRSLVHVSLRVERKAFAEIESFDGAETFSLTQPSVF